MERTILGVAISVLIWVPTLTLADEEEPAKPVAKGPKAKKR